MEINWSWDWPNLGVGFLAGVLAMIVVIGTFVLVREMLHSEPPPW